ncbi:MAG: undecaprenyl/decaprenyl-phosphate alpha-N-acetylglucosaminyl 1-phosphate transferase, partial [Alicyclobacillus sp.]|nr:undecaprenyl/decaprenyl-phosphate alpha-N-acetylglucosaminyl 1-phosphate transferase [Alicyclobacillus sp.]
MAEIAAGVIAFAVAWALIPFFRKLALRWQFVDLPSQRKVHTQPLPLLGGAAIFIGFVAATLITMPWWPTQHRLYVALLIGSVLLFGIGLVDDYFKTRGRDFPPMPRFLLQIVAAAVLAACGGTVKGFTVPFGREHFVAFPPYLSILVTVVWIVGVINVFNFLDGLDGLAAGIAAISAITLVFIALVKGDIPSAIWAVAIAGAALG